MVLSSFGPFPSGVFFTGAATAASDVVPAAYPVAIAGHPYNIEPRLYRRSNIPLQRQAEPGQDRLIVRRKALERGRDRGLAAASRRVGRTGPALRLQSDQVIAAYVYRHDVDIRFLLNRPLGRLELAFFY